MINNGIFAGEALTQYEEINNLSDACCNGDTIYVDGDGAVHLASESNTVDNGTVISEGTFAGETLTQSEEINNLSDAIYNGDIIWVDREGVAHLASESNTVDNGVAIPQGTFAGEALTQCEEINNLLDAIYNGDIIWIDREGVPHFDSESNTVDNGVAIPQGTFAASRPSDPDQWYNKNFRLFEAEVNAMRKVFPKAGYGFMKATGNMYWVIEMNVSQTGFAETWSFCLVYDKNHPHNTTFGGSIKVCPIKPKESDLKEKAKKYGRKGVPHLLHDRDLGTYLCTRRKEDVKEGRTEANTAVSVAGWAADWALHFEVGLRKDKVWNKFCDDGHFYSYKTCYKSLDLCKNNAGYQCQKCWKR